ncbi:MAG TPA: DUF2076 domain-containing protein [Lichenihabitans sp.]|jgi:hypothetical protein|nr:DUF2076 domain-containing protein [Lichenihabitans sp.]
MTPEERQLISGLFDRMRPAANQQRDREAESLIADQVRAQPYAPYLLSQTVIVQDQALQAANQKIQQLEAQVQQGQPRQEDTSFLGGLGRMFGGQPDPNQGRGPSVPTTGGSGPAPLPPEPGPFRGQGSGPWGGQQAGGAQPGGGMMGGGGGFLKGALGAAAGVAGGVLLADGIRGLFSGGNNPYGIASGLGGGMGGLGNPGGETIVNNYYDDNNNQGPDLGNYGDQGGGDQGGFDPGDGGYGGGGYSN